jgi:hypothetical protein
VKGKFQWSVDLLIKAHSSKVWEIADDISLIPQYHPDVDRVDLIDGQKTRGIGVKYQCNVLEGKGRGSCVEQVVDYVPGVKISTAMGEDTWGLQKIFADYVVESTVIPQGNQETILRFEGFYNPVGLFYKILNPLILRKKTRERSLEVMKGIKAFCEK